MFRSFILLVLLTCSLPSFAATIRGDVRDAKDSSTIVGVTVMLSSLDRTAFTDINGHYEIINVPDGTYDVTFTFTSYKADTKKVTVTGGSDITLDLILSGKNNTLQGANVRASRITHTENAVVLEMKKSSVVVSGISSAQISKTMDRNAADVVKRIPGVTIQDDRFIIVRGLAERYNTVWLNDAGAPSAEVDKKSFSFDIIPSGLIDRILIFKTPSPELPGDFAGGMVKIYTSSLPSKNAYTFGVSTSYRQGSTGTDFNFNKKSPTDWLGYDNGMRGIPAGTPEYVEANAPYNVNVSKAFGNDWIIQSKKLAPDFRLSGSAANVFRIGGGKFGNTLGVSYSNTSTNYLVQRYDWEDRAKQFQYDDRQSSNKVNVGVMDNLAYAIGNSRFEWRNLYNQIGTSMVTLRTLSDDTTGYSSVRLGERSYAMGYESRATYSTQLSGSHHNEADTRKYNWTLGYTDVFRNQPNLRRIKYNENENRPGEYNAQVQGGNVDIVNGGGRFYSELYENVYSFSQQFTQKVNLTKKFAFDLNIGSYLEYKSRFFNARELGYTLVPNATSLSYNNLGINEIFADAHVGGEGNFKMSENTSDYDRYNAQNKLLAGYVSVNVPVTEKIKVLTGVRYENNLASLKGLLNQRENLRDIQTEFFLPSINATYNFSPKSLLRVAYGKTVNRPEFRETAPFYFYDFDRRAGTYGAMFPHSFALNGDTLEVAEIHNVDMRYEWYPSTGEVIQVGGFYKYFKTPIQQVSYGSGDSRAFTYANGENAYCYGVEVDVRKTLSFIGEKIGGGFWKDLTLVGNMSFSKSELSIDSSRVINAQPKTPLEGQSNYVINVGAYYQNEKADIQGSLLYNVYGARLYSVGTSFDPSIGELPFNSLDFTISKTFYKHYLVNFGVQNLLDQTVRFVIDTDVDNKYDAKKDKPFSNYKPGRYFTLGVKVRF